ncbi:MAG: macrocin O-methyltransferase [Verrucomicrobiae bacterium]|nr:macrocin O-methyltransferase [Verrucomicrobiae bacterium]
MLFEKNSTIYLFLKKINRIINHNKIIADYEKKISDTVKTYEKSISDISHAYEGSIDTIKHQLEFNREHYLDLLHKVLTGVIYEDEPISELGKGEYDAQVREYGWDWPSKAHTMIGSKRLMNVRLLTESVLGNNVPGDLIETGVWRGGACVMMRGVLAAYGVTDRKVWLADSFSGLPEPDEKSYPLDANSNFHEYQELSVSIDMVKNIFEKYKFLDDQVVFLKGWFRDTLHNAPIEKIALLRLDGDLYESTIQALDALYEKVSKNGYIIVDDYHVVPQCKNAVEDFCKNKQIEPEIEEIDGVGIFWKKK